YEIELLHKNGSVVPVEARSLFIRDREGKPVGILAVHRDITERKRQTEELRRSREQLALIFNGVSDLVFLVEIEPGPRFRYVAVNPSALRTVGSSEEKIVGHTVEEVFSLEKAAITENYKAAVRAGQPITYEEQSNLPAGQLLFETTLTPLFDEHGRCTHLLGTSHEITARKRAEEALEERQRPYRNAFGERHLAIHPCCPA